MLYSLEGMWRVALPGFEGALHLPGTLDEGGIGGPDTGEDTWHPDPELGSGALASAGGPIATRLTRRHTYEGEARFVRRSAPAACGCWWTARKRQGGRRRR